MKSRPPSRPVRPFAGSRNGNTRHSVTPACNANTVDVAPPTPARRAQPAGRCAHAKGDGRRCIIQHMSA